MDEEDRYTRITLRLPKDLDRKLQESADATSKSKNAEIIARLEQSLSGADPAAAIDAISRLEVDLSDKDERLDETERLALLMSIALAATYGITRSALAAPDEDMTRVKNVLDAGMSAVRSFVSTYTPKGMEAVAKRVESLRDYIDPEDYKRLVKSVTVSDKTNTMLKQSEEAAVSIIQKALDKYNIQETPPSRRFMLFATTKDLLDPQEGPKK